MHHLTWQRLALVAAVAAVLAWAITRIAASNGYTPLTIPWTVEVVSVAAAVITLAFGWQVRQYQRGKRPSLSAIRAARTVVLAQASAYAGAVLAGGYGGYGFGVALEWSHEPRREVAISALVAAASGLVLLVAGAIAEHWCRTGGDDDEDAQRSMAH